MKKIKILNKNYNIFQLAVIIAFIIFSIGLIIAGVDFYNQKKLKKAAEAPLLKSVNECVEVCDEVYAQMGISDDEHFDILKGNIENAATPINKYYAAQTLMDYTSTVFLNFRSKEAAEYEQGDPNDYKARVYQESLNELQNKFQQKLGALSKARQDYTSVK